MQARGGGGGGATIGPGGKVVERVVEVEDDVDAIRERLRKEIEARMKQDLSEEAMAAAREVREVTGWMGRVGRSGVGWGGVDTSSRLQ
jgi:hypothetical protein